MSKISPYHADSPASTNIESKGKATFRDAPNAPNWDNASEFYVPQLPEPGLVRRIWNLCRPPFAAKEYSRLD